MVGKVGQNTAHDLLSSSSTICFFEISNITLLFNFFFFVLCPTILVRMELLDFRTGKVVQALDVAGQPLSAPCFQTTSICDRNLLHPQNSTLPDYTFDFPNNVIPWKIQLLHSVQPPVHRPLAHINSSISIPSGQNDEAPSCNTQWKTQRSISPKQCDRNEKEFQRS
jgi:hypothetical protein